MSRSYTKTGLPIWVNGYKCNIQGDGTRKEKNMKRTRESLGTPHPRNWANGRDFFIEQRDTEEDEWRVLRVVFVGSETEAKALAQCYCDEYGKDQVRMVNDKGRVVWDSATWRGGPSNQATLYRPMMRVVK